MSTLGDIMSTLGVFSTLEGYHEYTGGYHDKCGGMSLGKQLNLYENASVLHRHYAGCALKLITEQTIAIRSVH